MLFPVLRIGCCFTKSSPQLSFSFIIVIFKSCFFAFLTSSTKDIQTYKSSLDLMPYTKICAIFQVCTHDHLIITAFSPDLRDIKVSRHLPSIFLLHVLVSEAQYWWRFQLLSKTRCNVWLISSANQPNFLSVTLIFRTKRPSYVLHQQNTSFKRGPTHVSTDAHK